MTAPLQLEVVRRAFPRSSTKPLQAVGLLDAGWQPPDDACVARATASHSGFPEHLEVVRRTLAAAGLTSRRSAARPACRWTSTPRTTTSAPAVPALVHALRALGVDQPVLDELGTSPVLGGGVPVGELRVRASEGTARRRPPVAGC